MTDLKKKIKEMRKLSDINAFGEPLRAMLEMVAETEEEKKQLIEATFTYLHYLYEDDPNYNDEFDNLKPTFENFVAVYYTVSEFEFLHAWTFALATFNYAEAIKNDKKKSSLPYIG